jgi:hypothetical protein
MATLTSLSVAANDSIVLPSGTESQKPGAVIQTFTATGTTSWTCPAGVTSVEALVVAGGGGGGLCYGGGGGGGAVIYNASLAVIPGNSYTVTVGAGGLGTSAGGPNGTNGGNSVFSSITATGGGGGGAACANAGSAGGSGGGGSNSAAGGAGTTGGNNGGAATGSAGGGGGGAGGPGGPSIPSQSNTQGAGPTTYVGRSVGGYGGPGRGYSISGKLVYYGGGGGGQGEIPGRGGVGGGADGMNGFPQIGNPAAPNTGGGGGGGLQTTYGDTDSPAVATLSSTGGSGIVIIRYTPASSAGAVVGQLRQNTTYGTVETYRSTGWTNLGDVPTNRLGMSREYAATSATQIKQVTGTNVNGWYWLNPGGLGARQFYCDMNYDGGGWVMVAANRRNTQGMNNLNYANAMGPYVNIRGGVPGDNLAAFNMFVGMAYWRYLGGYKTTNKITLTLLTSNGSAQPPSGTNSNRAQMNCDYIRYDGAFINGSNYSSEVNSSGNTAGFYSSHFNGQPLTTWDYDQDAYGSNCSQLYNNSPFWYGACWNGNWFGGGGGYADAWHWYSSGGDNYDYGAAYVK